MRACVCRIAIFCAALALSTGLEIVVFSPARRASRKLLERIVEFVRLLDCGDRIEEYNQVTRDTLTVTQFAAPHTRSGGLAGAMPPQLLPRHQESHPQLSVQGAPPPTLPRRTNVDTVYSPTRRFRCVRHALNPAPRAACRERGHARTPIHTHTRHQSRMSAEDHRVAAYLVGEPVDDKAEARGFNVVYWGDSKTVHRSQFKETSDTIKELCCGTKHAKATTFNYTTKQWGTYDIDNVPKLISSGLWSPSGFVGAAAFNVLAAAEKMINAKKAVERSAKRVEEHKQAEARARRDADATAKAEAIRLRDTMGNGFSREDIDRAERDYGISEEMLMQTPSFAWLGPRCSAPMTRVDRWFRFLHNGACGANVVCERDLVPEFKACKANAQVVIDDASQIKKRKVVREETPAEAIARHKAYEVRRVKEREELRQLRENDVHRIRFEQIIAAARDLPPPAAVVTRHCPQCGVKLTPQFLECQCGVGNDEGDPTSRDWKICGICNSVFHAQKVPCFCAA